MAKEGLDYFPLTCTFDDKIELIEAEFGLKGLAIIIKLFQKIYGDKGYYCDWNSEIELLFSRKTCGLPEGDTLVSEVITSAVKRGLFSSSMFQRYSILTSSGIQKRFFEATKRRNKFEAKPEYLLVENPQNPKNVNKNDENVCKNDGIADISEQSKVKESIEEESTENQDIPIAEKPKRGRKPKADKPKEPKPEKAVKHRYGEYEHVLLTDEERDRLFNEYGEGETLDAIRYLDEYIEMKGYTAKSHNLVLRKWVFRALKEEKQRNARVGQNNAKNDPFSALEAWANNFGGSN